MVGGLRRVAVVALQVGAIFALGSSGYALASRLHVPLPGNVLAIVALYVLLATRIVRLDWIERGGTVVTGNLVLFLVPLAAGLITFGGVLQRNGAGLFVAMLVSLACGLLVTGRIAERRQP